MSSWADSPQPGPIDHDAFPYMGADPCWTPEREFKHEGCPDARAGACLLCGGDRGFPLTDADGRPIVDRTGSPMVVSAVPPGSHRVCVRCGRSGHDQHSLGLSTPRSGLSAPGYVSRDGVSVPERYARLLN